MKSLSAAHLALMPTAALSETASPEEPAEEAIRYGWDPDVLGPTEADLYVAPDGDDDALGTHDRPLASIAAGVARLAARGTGALAIRGGLYREAVSLDALQGSIGSPYRVHRYGRERVTLSAAEILRGWSPCGPEVAEILGNAVEGVYVVHLQQSALEHGDPLALNLHEAGSWCAIATDRADLTMPEAMADQNRFHEAVPVLGPDDHIMGFIDSRLAGQSPAYWKGVRVLIYHAPNLVSPAEIASVDPLTGKVSLADQDYRVQRSGRGKVPKFRYSLQNAATGLAPGTWLVRPVKDGQLAIYFRPRDPANLADQIEVTLRDHCLDIGSAKHVDIFGLEFVQAAGTKYAEGSALRCNRADSAENRGLTVRHCRIAGTLSSSTRGYGGLYLRGINGLVLQNLSVSDIRGAFGVFLSDCRNVNMRALHLRHISQSAARFYGLRDSILAFSLFQDSGTDAHANKFNFYEGSDAVLVYGVRTVNTGGYVTYQKASRIFFAFCEFDASKRIDDGRVLASQNHGAGSGHGGSDGSGDPVIDTFRYWNLTLLPDAVKSNKANALSLGPGTSSQRHALHNSVLHGGGFADIYVRKSDAANETRSYNAYTGLAYWQSARYGWRLREGEFQLRPGARHNAVGRDMRPDIFTHVAPLFPGFTEWDLDIDGRHVDWTTPPLGARVG